MPSDDCPPALNTILVSSLDDPGLADLLTPYRNQKDAWLRVQTSGGTGLGGGQFMAEGELVVRTLVESVHRVVSVLCTPQRLETIRAALEALPTETPILVASRESIAEIVGFDLHRGVLALGERASPPDVGGLIARTQTLVVCEDLANHDNVGSVFRNVACLAGTRAGVLLSPGCCDPLYRKSLRVSMGHALHVPFATLEPWPASLDRLASEGFEVLACTPDRGATDLRTLDRIPNTRRAILIGAEGPGLTGEAMARARRVRIPMSSGPDSLNVATALAVALSHLLDPD